MKNGVFFKNKTLKLIIFFLLAGIIFRLLLTQNGNFIFNMDNARDMVDIREMVVLQKPRLIGHTAAIEGVFYGPYWYYLSSMFFLLSGGNPYANIILQIILWVIGGYFAMKLASRYGMFSTITVGSLWVASDFVILSSTYAFNPNPVLFLSPLLIFLLDKYLTTKKTVYSIFSFALVASFFSNEILFAILLPIIIIGSIILTKNYFIFKRRSFWLGVLTFLIVLSPHLFFELRHDFFMTKSLINFLTNGGNEENGFNIVKRIETVVIHFEEILKPTFLNVINLGYSFIALFLLVTLKLIRDKVLFKDVVLIILILFIFIPVIGFTVIPVNISSWHFVGVIAALIILSGILIAKSLQQNFLIKLTAFIIFFSVIVISISNFLNYYIVSRKPSNDPSMFANELNAVDFVYKNANGKNFKVYTYLPSVIDYPYQYLFWWRGLNKYGYLPQDYAYEPNKPEYIAQKDKLDTGIHPQSSGLVFLIKEPDRGLRHLWENTFTTYPFLSSEKVGPLIIETRLDSQQ